MTTSNQYLLLLWLDPSMSLPGQDSWADYSARFPSLLDRLSSQSGGESQVPEPTTTDSEEGCLGHRGGGPTLHSAGNEWPR